MTQRQQYAVVPMDASRRMIDSAARVDEDGYDAMLKAMIKNAPPPPDQVLSDDQVMAVYHEWLNVPGYANESDLIRLAERAVLQHFQGAKNG